MITQIWLQRLQWRTSSKNAILFNVSDIMMNTMVVVIMYGSNIVDDYNDYDGCIVFFVLFDFISRTRLTHISS